MANAQLGAVVRYLRGMAATHENKDQTDGELLRAFVVQRDQTAFSALVKRHGPFVLAVCRRMLHHVQDAEDAFQATFLVLARQAAAIRKEESLASWLHGVAYRMSSNARRAAARRRKYESQANGVQPSNPSWIVAWREVQNLVDAEIERLPAIYREPFILCCLENRSSAEVARKLGQKEGTVRSRVARARRQLQQRLTKRGVSLTAVLGVAAVWPNASLAAVPALLANSTVEAALDYTGGRAAAGLVSAEVTALIQGVSKNMFYSKLKVATVLLLTACIGATGLGMLRHQVLAANEPDTKQTDAQKLKPEDPERTAVATTKREAAESVKVRGRVLDFDDKPLAGAKLYLGPTNPKEPTFPVRATTGQDGRFEFAFARSELDKTYSDNPDGQVLAMAKNFGSDWGSVRAGDNEIELTLRLGKDVPINGRILDQDARPVAGAKVRVTGVTAHHGQDLKDVFEVMRQGHFEKLNWSTWSGPLPGQPKVLMTGADGRIRLTGFGSDRLVYFEIEGPGIATGRLKAMTRPGEAVVVSPNDKYYGAAFDHVATASRPIRGVVRDKVPGKPVAGVEIADVSNSILKTRTDQDGRYELLGLAKSESYDLDVRPANGQLYFAGGISFADTAGLDPLPANIELVSGITLRGKVTDKGTGKPVARARVDYHLLYPNPQIKKLAALNGSYAPRSEATTGPDGTFALVVLPGPGVLGSAGPNRETYMSALVTPKDLKDFFKDWAPGVGNDEEALSTAADQQSRSFIAQRDYNALVLLDADEKAKSLTQDILLEPGRTLKGSVVGADGKPLSGVTVYGLEWRDTVATLGTGRRQAQESTLKTSTFTVQRINPRRASQLLFLHKEKKLGCYLDLKGSKSGPLTIKLQACGSASGRIVDKDGQPVPEMRLDIRIVDMSGIGQFVQVITGRDGRFRAEGLVPGAKYSLLRQVPSVRSISEIVVESGKNKDLGDVDGHVEEEP